MVRDMGSAPWNLELFEVQLCHVATAAIKASARIWPPAGEDRRSEVSDT